MADENTRNGANPNNGDPLADQVSADQHSAFLDDEELNEQLPDEFDADDRTALTAAHEGSNVQGDLTNTDSDRASLFAEDPFESALAQTNAESFSITARGDELPFGDAIYGEAPSDRGLNGGPDDALSAPSQLNGQSSDETIVDDQPALTAAHQGSRATSVPTDSAAAFDPADQADLFGDTPERASASASPTSRPASDALLGNPDADILGAPGSELPIGGENPAQNANEGGGRGSAAASEAAGETAAGSTDTGAIDELPLGDGDADQGGSSPSASDGTTDDGPLLDQDLSGQAGSGSSGNDDGLGGSGDQSGSAGTGPADDDPIEYVEETASDGIEYVEETASDGGGGGGGGNGVNPIIGDKFDNNLVGTDGRDMINAKDGDDTVSGGAGDDLIMGKKGDDLLEGGLGDDTLKGGHGDDTFLFSDADFDGNAWTDVVDGQGQNGNPASDYDTIDLTNITQGWTLEVDGAGAGAEATNLTNPTEYTEGGGEFSGTITFDDGSTIAFDNIEKVDW